ncbi:hypothetical protein [Streptomyces purpurogeneiscleroticus]|uniref:hypothetical protein n=1 Tax=Streptomyces purpurogeneiscleroticus TaxID=68259 RepID=UPI001CC01B7C|nr:hypothetical protein [Streptomyces purpurogeneiscleroticus]MBZ4019486.1 hypothetical protein [Streptomyces purpurogeneiscleroticus]
MRERSDLQKWITRDPALIEPGLLILTEEYDKWATSAGGKVRDRLDLLALDSDGHLVVIELKRDAAPDDVHLQAVTYAAMVSRLILVSRTFPRQVTSSAVWLNEMGIDVKLVQFQLWDTGASHVITASVLYPVPGLEEFTVAPARALHRHQVLGG